MSIVILWFRRDLRLTDNRALTEGVRDFDRVVLVYVHAPDEETPWEPGAASRWWLHHSLERLQRDLGERGSRLILVTGPTLAALRRLVKETGARGIYWNRCYEPHLVRRDAEVAKALRSDGTEVRTFPGALVTEPPAILNGAGKPYRVFTAYFKQWRQRLPGEAPVNLPGKIPLPPAVPRSRTLEEFRLLPDVSWDHGLAEAWVPGEGAALDRLAQFCANGLAQYHGTRDRPDLDGVSRLSPRLHFGELSPRQVTWAALDAADRGRASGEGVESFLGEIAWREFAHYVLHHWPQTDQEPLRPAFKRFPWRRRYDRLLEAWQRGRTGYPMVDAGMRELWRTGWMHNRVRMLVASFLVKNLRVPWQEGARWFWDTLVDADLANNTLGWQWTAGCGVDAAPFFRIFNPVRQGERFDPDGVYVKRWIPELDAAGSADLHRPRDARDIGTAGNDHDIYPPPLVDFAKTRQEALDGFRRVKGS